jgi:ABC-type Mn2+/Zn2+ transport system permease subunit
MGGIFSIAFLLAPVLFATQWRRGPLFSLLIAIAAAASSAAAAWMLVQNTKYTFAILAAGIVTLLYAVALAVRKLMGVKAAPVSSPEPAATVPANAPQS